MENIIEGTEVINRIHREKKIKQGMFMDRVTADDQFQIANESLKQVYTHIQTKEEIEGKITALVKNNPEKTEAYLYSINWDFQDLAMYIENGSPKDLEDLYNQMSSYFRSMVINVD